MFYCYLGDVQRCNQFCITFDFTIFPLFRVKVYSFCANSEIRMYRNLLIL